MKDKDLGKYFNQKADGFIENEGIEKTLANEVLIEQTRKVVDHIDLLKQMESIDRERAYKKVKSKIEHKSRIIIKLVLLRAAAVVFIPLLAFSIWQTQKLSNIKSSIVQNEISTPATLRSVFTLPDGTKVWMNGSSTLNYPTQFTKNERLVELNGEAFFDVAPNNLKPFRVKTGNLYVEAVGTSFNCMAFADDNKIEIVLTEGKVNILKDHVDGKKVIATLEPNQMATYYKNQDKISRKAIDPSKYIAWMDGKIIFKNDHLQDVLLRLERWYNVAFEIDPKINGDYAFTGSFAGEELTQILKYIEYTTPVKFEIKQIEKNSEQLHLKKRITIKPVL